MELSKLTEWNWSCKCYRRRADKPRDDGKQGGFI